MTGPGTYPACYEMVTILFPWGKVVALTPSSAEVKGRVEL